MERLREELEAAQKTVDRSQPGWERQAAAVRRLADELAAAERTARRRELALATAQAAADRRDAAEEARTQRAIQRAEREAVAAERAAQRAIVAQDRAAEAYSRAFARDTAMRQAAAAPSSPAGGGMDPARAQRMSTLGFGLANTVQDAYYNPAYAVNNVMFLAQQSGGISKLGEDIKEFALVAGGAAIRTLPGVLGEISSVAVAAAPPLAALGAAGLAVNAGLKEAGLGWSDFGAVLANTKPVLAAGEAVAGLGQAAAGAWETLSNTQVGEAVDSVWDGVRGVVHETANVALGWDAATEAVLRNKQAVDSIAADAAQANRTSAALRGDFERDITGIRSEDDFAVVMARINKALAENRLTEEDYAATLEKANAVRDRAIEQAERATDAERKRAAAEAAAEEEKATAEAGRRALAAQAMETDEAAARLNDDAAAAEKARREAEQEAERLARSFAPLLAGKVGRALAAGMPEAEAQARAAFELRGRRGITDANRDAVARVIVGAEAQRRAGGAGNAGLARDLGGPLVGQAAALWAQNEAMQARGGGLSDAQAEARLREGVARQLRGAPGIHRGNIDEVAGEVVERALTQYHGELMQNQQFFQQNATGQNAALVATLQGLIADVQQQRAAMFRQQQAFWNGFRMRPLGPTNLWRGRP